MHFQQCQTSMDFGGGGFVGHRIVCRTSSRNRLEIHPQVGRDAPGVGLSLHVLLSSTEGVIVLLSMIKKVSHDPVPIPQASVSPSSTGVVKKLKRQF